MNRSLVRSVVSAAALVPMVLVGLPCRAGTVVAGSSAAYNISVDLDATVLSNSASVNVGPTALAQGSAPAPYSDSDSIAGVNASAGTTNINLGLAQVQILPLTLALDTLNASADSDVDGGTGSRFATAMSQVVNGLNFTLLGVTIDPVIGPTTTIAALSITADTITSTSTASGDYGSLTASGTSNVQNLLIKAGTTTLLSFSGDLAPNQTLNFSLPAILGGGSGSLTLNEVTITGDGISSINVATNLLSLGLDDLNITVLGNTVASIDGQIILGHSEAHLEAVPPQAVPEPSTFALAGLGAVGLLGVVRRRRSS